MQEKTYKLLVADEGMVLTDGKHFCSAVQLGVDKNPNDWREITKEEAEIEKKRIKDESSID